MAVNIRFLAGENILDSRGRLTTDAAARLNKIIELANAATDTLAEAPSLYVAKDTGTTDWTAWTGTADRATHATYTAAAISNPPTQAQVQAIANAVQNNSRGMKALLDDDLASGVRK